jgi:hypothetical protein
MINFKFCKNLLITEENPRFFDKSSKSKRILPEDQTNTITKTKSDLV